MNTRTRRLLLSSVAVIGTLVIGAPVIQAQAPEPGFQSIFDGKTLAGWHVSAKTNHSKASGNKTGGRWVVEKGAIVGSQDIPGNGGIVLTDKAFGNFEVVLEMNNDFGPDSGLFMRSTEEGSAYQAMIDYHSKGNLMGVYGERMQGKPTARNFDFGETVTEIVATNEGVPTVLPVLPQSWRYFWRHGQWNELRAESLATHPPLPRGSMASSLWSLPTPRSGCQTQAASPCKYTAGATVRNSLCAIETFEQSRWIDPRKTRTADCVRLSHPQRAENSKQGIL